MIRTASVLKHGLRCHNHSKRRKHLWTSSEIRKTFIDFFIGKDHRFVPSSSVLPSQNDGSYFVNAGMNQFKPLFLGTVDGQSEMASYKRVTNYQKCIRVGGKHNDLDDVGRDHYHHTFFEMLGNWSFNDYGKAEACKMAWELLTKVYKIPGERLFVTYFEGDEGLNLEADTTCKEMWLNIGVPEHQILPFGLKDNFWVMGETGPCGPCTEIHFCHRENVHEGRALVNSGSDSVVEIWNLVFMEYDRRPDGSLTPLPKKHIDTGMGLERLTALLNGSTSNYDTDLFQGIFSHIRKSCKAVPYAGCLDDPVDTAYRVVGDHSRMFTVAIGDGLLPGRKESEGKLRTVIYKSLYQANEVLKAPSGFLKSLVPVVIESLSPAYPDLSGQQNMIMDMVQETEERYLESVVAGRKAMRKAMQQFGVVKTLTGDQILQVQEGKFGRGVPFDIISLLADEFHVSLDAEDFERKLKINQAYQREAGRMPRPLFDQHDVNFLLGKGTKLTVDRSSEASTYSEANRCYEFPKVKGKVVALKVGGEFVSEVCAGSSDCGVILDETSFYAEGGGQVSDIGELLDPSGKLCGKVSDVSRCGGFIFHRIRKVENNVQLGDEVYTSTDPDHRMKCMANHTATHVIHYALEKVLGKVRQQGSCINDNHLTLSFACLKSRMSPEDLKQVVKIIKDVIHGGYAVRQFEAPLKDISKARQLFKLENEVYPNIVKVVSIAKHPRDHEDPKFYEEANTEQISLQLCGGTHVTNTGHLQELVITNLEGSEQGTKRLTAVTGDLAKQALCNYELLKQRLDKIDGLENVEEVDKEIKCIDKLLSELLLPRVDREKILERMKQINFNYSQQRKAEMLSDIGQTITDEINKKLASENGSRVLDIPFKKSRDAIGGLLAVNAQEPVFVLSNHGPIHMGIVYIPKNFTAFQSKDWAEYLCQHLGGEHLPPKGKFSKHNISIIKMQIKGDRKKEIADILKVAEQFLIQKQVVDGLRC